VLVSTMQTCILDPPMVHREDTLPEGSVYSGEPKYRSKHLVKTGDEARGLETLPEVVEYKWEVYG